MMVLASDIPNKIKKRKNWNSSIKLRNFLIIENKK
jgi:hypothetical protein